MSTAITPKVGFSTRHFTRIADPEKSKDRQSEVSNHAQAVQTYALVLEACGQLADKRVLDCGFGTGELARTTDVLGGAVDAIDVVSTRISQLREDAPAVYWSAAELSDWRLPRNVDPYDVIIACEVLQYVDFDKVVANLLGALDDRGRLVIIIPNSDCPIVQQESERRDNRYVGVSLASLPQRLAAYCDDYLVAYRGIRIQVDQSLVPYVSDSWSAVTPDGNGPTTTSSTQPNRVQIVLARR